MQETRNRKIGVLIPQSNTYPLMAKSFLNGLKLAIGDVSCEYIVESVGFGSDEKQILNSYQKLAFQNDVDLTTGLIGHHGYEELVNFASQNGEILLAADMGAKKPIVSPSGVFQNSLGLYDSLGALVRYFESNSIKNIATSTCYYEAGYDFIESLSTALTHTEDSSFAGHYITPLNPREDESQIMTETFTEIQPDAIVAFHNAIYAKEHATFLNENGVHKNFPIYALPFSYSNDLVKEYTNVFEKIKLVSNWFPELENQENQKFITAYQDNHNKTPDCFALLGYENGLVIRETLKNDPKNIKETIENINVDGPRGTIQFNNELNRTTYKNYVWEIINNQTSDPTKKIVDQIDEPLNLSLADLQKSGQTGWFNSYLCH